MTTPSRHFRLTCWWLLYHVAVEKILDRQDEVDACLHSQLRLDLWDQQKALFPRQWAKLLAKRQRRLNWLNEHGSMPEGWTPPDLQDPKRSAGKPIKAYLARRKLTLKEFEAANGYFPIKSKGYGLPQVNWHLYRRIKSWQGHGSGSSD